MQRWLPIRAPGQDRMAIEHRRQNEEAKEEQPAHEHGERVQHATKHTPAFLGVGKDGVHRKRVLGLLGARRGRAPEDLDLLENDVGVRTIASTSAKDFRW